MILLTTEDFFADSAGRLQLVSAVKTNGILQAYIDDNEAIYIRQLLGVELGNLLIAAIQAGDPIDQRYQNIIDPFSLQIKDASIFIPAGWGIWWGFEWWGWGYDDCTFPQIHESVGLKKMLMAMIFYDYVTDQSTQYSQSGVVTANAETSNVKNMENGFRFGEQRYNAALETAASIQWRCFIDEPDTYPEYEGLGFTAKYSPVL